MANTKVTSNVIADNAVGITQLNVSDGSDGQALVTNGAGTLSFATVGVSGISSSADATAITIDSSERVGIGESSPDELLVIGGDAKIKSTNKLHFTNTSDQVFIHAPASNTLALSTNNTESIRIDSTGAVGLKKTPPSGLHTGWSQLFIGEKGSVISENANSGGLYGTWLTDNLYLKSSTGAFAYITTDESSAYRQEAGVHQWFTQASGSADAAVTLSEKMRITSSGGIGFGTTSPSSFGGGNFEFSDTSTNQTGLRVTAATKSTEIGVDNDGGYLQTVTDGGGWKFYTSDGGVANKVAQVITSAGIVTKQYQPAFHAYGATSATSDADVIYANTYVNTGNHYSTTNGRFTAPVAGVYVFFWSAIGNNNNDVYRYWIMKNGSKSIANSGNDIHLRLDTLATGSEYEFGTRVQMLALAANDYVQINFKADSGSSTYVGSQDDYMNFGGFLIG